MSGHPRPIAKRFWAKVARPADDDACWIWTGSTTYCGYGQIFHDGRNRRATHVSWELHHGKPFPEGMHACHRCDNPPCVNPAHIFPGTIADNARDSRAKGRHFKAAMTRCIRGHEFTPENVYINTVSGCRRCRICIKAADRARTAKARALREARAALLKEKS